MKEKSKFQNFLDIGRIFKISIMSKMRFSEDLNFAWEFFELFRIHFLLTKYFMARYTTVPSEVPAYR